MEAVYNNNAHVIIDMISFFIKNNCYLNFIIFLKTLEIKLTNAIIITYTNEIQNIY